MNAPAPPSPRIRLLLGFFVLLSLVELVSLLVAGRLHSNDFKHLWLGTRVLIEGGSPYDPQMLLFAARQYGIETINPYVYLPATALFLWPLGKMSFAAAMLSWFVLNAILAWGAVLLGPRWVRLEKPWRAQLLGALFLIGSMPFMRQMTAGQMNLVVLAALLLAWGWLIRGRQVPAGVVLGLAAAFKIAPFFFLFPMLGLKRWRAAGGLIGGFAAANLVSLALFGGGVHREALPVLSNMGYGQSTWAQFGMDFYRDPFNQSVNSLLHHLFTENPYTVPWFDLGAGMANGLTWVIGLILFGSFAALLGRYFASKRDEAWSDAESAIFLLGAMLMLLLPSLCWDHYALQALPAVFWIAGRSQGRTGAWSWGALLLAFALLSIPWMHTAEAFRQGPGILLMSFRLWGLLLLTLVLFVQADRSLRPDFPAPSA